MPFTFEDGHKFALLAVKNVYCDRAEEQSTQISDGTLVLSAMPLDVQSHWTKWIGSLRTENLNQSNLVLVRSKPSENPEILDHEHEELGKHLSQTFYLLQLSGVLEYDAAHLLKGSVVNGEPIVRQMFELGQFRQTRGYTRYSLSLDRLEQATRFRTSLVEMESSAEGYDRAIRGLNVLMNGLEQETGHERIHQFIRSLEALILPDVGSTRRQFIHRCQTFAKPGDESRRILGEAFDMRSDAEHLNDWDQSLQAYPGEDREHVALQRTRQMERLASFAYSRILESDPLRDHFRDYTSQRDFWTQLDDARRRGIWGDQLDLALIQLVHSYHADAFFSM
ncbi:hypothetical protein MYX65_06880 [Acidobacteria bacterium AH-259-L09]|nr:hypothetical protein [Acidobacteria bacterium AH-259-L09]